MRRFPYHFLFRVVGHESEFSSSAITIDIHLLDPGVDRVMAEPEECRLEQSWISIGHQTVGDEILNLSEHLRA